MLHITHEDLRTVSTLLILATTVPVVVFVINYCTRFPWYKNQGGWNLLIFMAVVGEFLILTIYARVTRHTFPDWLEPFMWLQLAAASWHRLLILVEVEVRQRRKDKLKQDV